MALPSTLGYHQISASHSSPRLNGVLSFLQAAHAVNRQKGQPLRDAHPLPGRIAVRTRFVPCEQPVHLSPGDDGVVSVKTDSNRSAKSACSAPTFFPDDTAQRMRSDLLVPTVGIGRDLDSFIG